MCYFCGADTHPLNVRCPSIKAYDYYPDGKIKRVEFVTYADFLAPQVRPAELTVTADGLRHINGN